MSIIAFSIDEAHFGSVEAHPSAIEKVMGCEGWISARPDQFAPKEKTDKKQGRANLENQDWRTDIIGTYHHEDQCLWLAGRTFQFI
jgi:hypothetical protein